MRMRTLIALIFLGFVCLGVSRAALPSRNYRITGVVLSVRDGAPIPYCRISANAVAVIDVGPATSPTPTPPRGQGQPAGPMGQSSGGPRSASAGPLQATADSSGRFSLEVPRAGAWRLTATARGFRGQNYDQHDGYFSAVVLTETAPTYTLTFRLHPDSVLTGLIFDEVGEPVASAQVTALLVAPPMPGGSPSLSRERPTGSGRTDDRGRYEIGSLTPGTYRLRVQAQPWYAAGSMGMQFSRSAQQAPSPDPSLDYVYPITWFPGTDDEASADTIKLADGEERQADFYLTAIPSVHLKIPRADPVNPPTPGDQRNRQQVRPATVTRVGGDVNGGFQQISMNGSNNEWDFGGLAPGTYEVRIPGPDAKSNDVRQIEVHSGSQTVITLEGSRSLVPVQLKLDGIAKSSSAVVEFIDSETGARISSSNPRGRGEFQGGGLRDEPPPDGSPAAGRTVMLPPHEFSVRVSGASGAYLTSMSAEGAKVAGRLVTVSDPATVTLHLADQHAAVDGVARVHGEPAAGAMVLLVPATLGMAGNLNTIERDETNTDGSFRMNSVTPGEYILVVIDHGWNVDWRDPATLGQYLIHGKPIDLRTTPNAREEIEAATAK